MIGSPRTIEEKVKIAILEVLTECTSCIRILPKIKKYLEITDDEDKTKTSRHFHTICHNVMWTKNVLVKFNLGNPDKVKFLGHSYHTFDSPVKDIVLFFLTSVQTRVLRNHFDDLLRFYHQHFIQTLKELKIPISNFSYELFLKEFCIYTSQVIGHALFILLFVIYGKESGSNSPVEPPVLNSRNDMPLTAKEKVWWFLQECDRRGWLNN